MLGPCWPCFQPGSQRPERAGGVADLGRHRLLRRVGTCWYPTRGSRRPDLPDSTGSVGDRGWILRCSHYGFTLLGCRAHSQFRSGKSHGSRGRCHLFEVRGECLPDCRHGGLTLPWIADQVPNHRVKTLKISLTARPRLTHTERQLSISGRAHVRGRGRPPSMRHTDQSAFVPARDAAEAHSANLVLVERFRRAALSPRPGRQVSHPEDSRHCSVRFSISPKSSLRWFLWRPIGRRQVAPSGTRERTGTNPARHKWEPAR